jgi:hypothetical protein
VCLSLRLTRRRHLHKNSDGPTAVPSNAIAVPCNVIASASQGIEVPFQAIEAPFQGIEVPFEGTAVPLNGIETPFKDVKASLREVEAPFKGTSGPWKEVPIPWKAVAITGRVIWPASEASCFPRLARAMTKQAHAVTWKGIAIPLKSNPIVKAATRASFREVAVTKRQVLHTFEES